MNVAQQVRVWVAVGISLLLGLAVGMAAHYATSPLYTDPFSGVNVYDIAAVKDWIGAAVWFLVVDGVLAGFTIFRMFNPIKKKELQSND